MISHFLDLLRILTSTKSLTRYLVRGNNGTYNYLTEHRFLRRTSNSFEL